MIKIIGNRGSGKTTRLLELAKQDGYVIVEPNMRMRDYVKRMATEKGYNVNVISSYELLNPQYGARNEKYLVDELDMFLNGLGIKGYSNGMNGR